MAPPHISGFSGLWKFLKYRPLSNSENILTFTWPQEARWASALCLSVALHCEDSPLLACILVLEQAMPFLTSGPLHLLFPLLASSCPVLPVAAWISSFTSMLSSLFILFIEMTTKWNYWKLGLFSLYNTVQKPYLTFPTLFRLWGPGHFSPEENALLGSAPHTSHACTPHPLPSSVGLCSLSAPQRAPPSPLSTS